MGGLAVTPIEPAPRYEFEMLKKDGDESEGDSPTLFLHYKVKTFEVFGTYRCALWCAD